MNKREFIDGLKSGLEGLPNDDISERLDFYSEMIDDCMEEGMTEEEAVAGLGTIEEIVSQTVAQTPLKKLVKERVKSRRSLKAWEKVLIAVGSPVWLPLLIAAFAVLLSFYIVLWALLICLWAVFAALAVSAAAGAIGGVIELFRGETTRGLALIGAGLVLAGLAILLFFACKAASKGIIKLTRSIALWIKYLFVGKGKESYKNE